MYDIVLFGATGYTGQLCAKYIRDTYDTKNTIQWALAGRSRKRLEAIREKLGLKCGLIEANTSDPISTENMVKQTKCIANLVGPYLRLGGTIVVEACARLGCGYVDLAGESAFYSQVVDRFHTQAQSTGAVIVPSAGFDSVPGDLTTFLAAQHLYKSIDEADQVIDSYVGISAFGWFSSGTIESITVMAEEGNGDMVRSNRANWLSPVSDPPHENRFELFRFHPSFNRYAAWFFFAPHNARVAYRTWGLLRSAAKDSEKRKSSMQYSADFAYQEGIIVPFWPLTILASIIIKVFTMSLILFPLFRALVRAVLPSNGGPPEIVNTRLGFMDARAVVKTVKGRSCVCQMSSKGDPGYYLTARMLIETGLTISRTQKKDLPILAQQGGVLPASLAGGQVLADRLRTNAGFTIRII